MRTQQVNTKVPPVAFRQPAPTGADKVKAPTPARLAKRIAAARKGIGEPVGPEESRAAEARNKPSVDIEQVTPELAARWLQHNDRNRSARDERVGSYVRDMLAGDWELTGSGVQFDITGNLADGQQRLMAVVESGTTQWFTVFRGLQPKAQKVIDTGAPRTVADALHMSGERNVNVLGAAITLAIRYTEGTVLSQRHILSRSEQSRFLEENPDLRAAVELASYYRYRLGIPQTVVAVAAWRLNKIDVQKATEFFSALSSLTNQGGGSPILALDHRVKALKQSKKRVSQAEWLRLIFKTWIDWRAGRPVDRYQSTAVGTPVIIPEPK